MLIIFIIIKNNAFLLGSFENGQLRNQLTLQKAIRYYLGWVIGLTYLKYQSLEKVPVKTKLLFDLAQIRRF